MVEPPTDTSKNGLRLLTGEIWLHYVPLSRENFAVCYLAVDPDNVELVPPSEEMLLLHSPDLRSLVARSHNVRDCPTFKRLVETFGASDIDLGWDWTDAVA